MSKNKDKENFLHISLTRPKASQRVLWTGSTQ